MVFTLVLSLIMAPSVATAAVIGFLGNFDVINDTGQTAYGFEIELEGLHSSDITDVFGGPGRGFPTGRGFDPATSVERYGAPTVTEYTNGAIFGTQSDLQCPLRWHQLGLQHAQRQRRYTGRQLLVRRRHRLWSQHVISDRRHLLLGVGQGEDGACVTLGDLLAADGVLDLLGEVEQPDQVRDRRAVEAEAAGKFFLGAAVPGQVVAEGAGLLERVEVLALEVLDHRQLADPLVVEVEDPGGDLVELRLDAGAQPSLAGDELVAVVDRPDQDRLEHAVLAERVGQGGDLGRVELAAGLERVRVDLIDREVRSGRTASKRAGLVAPFVAAEQGLQAASESSLVIHGR